MKITKSQLKQIIKEEVKSITELEWGGDVQARAHGGAGAQLQMELNGILRDLINRGLTKKRAEASIATVFYGHGTPQPEALKTEVSREVRDQRKAELVATSARAARRGEHEDSIQNRINISKARSSDLDGAEQGYDGTPASADARRERRDLLDKIERLEAELQNLRGIRK
jgi:hypothetical protein|tara:strand:+ start:463 stop:972 length:510 start_codon:yes stop_codon:yes gene_type:complete